MTDTTPIPVEQIEALAPWPDQDSGNPTAAITRWFAVQAEASYARVACHPYLSTDPEYDAAGKPSGTYGQAVRDFLREAELAWTRYVAAYLLRERLGLPVDLLPADALRRDVDTAEMASETVAGWVLEYGIDPEQIIQAVRAERGRP